MLTIIYHFKLDFEDYDSGEDGKEGDQNGEDEDTDATSGDEDEANDKFVDALDRLAIAGNDSSLAATTAVTA